MYGSRSETSSPHPGAWTRGLWALSIILLFLATPCRAAWRSCRPTDSPLLCRLDSLLTFLYAAAALLGLLLFLAVLAAVRTYKRKARKITPDEITPDAK